MECRHHFSHAVVEPRRELCKAQARATKRIDLPKRRNTLKLPKANLRNAVRLAMSKGGAGEAAKRVQQDFYANSSRAAKRSRRKTVKDILAAANQPLPLSNESLKVLAGTLRESGYKSTHIYLAEAKTMHVESGHDWSHLLDRYFKLCMAAAKRGAGPRKKAPEIPAEVWQAASLLSSPQESRWEKVKLPSHLFAMAVHWMLREIEVANLTAADIKFYEKERLVSMCCRESKGDTAGLGITHTLQCICEAGCDLACPYSVLEVLVNNAALKGAKDGHLAINHKGDVASKSEIVSAWKNLYGKTTTGHSARRSGALQYNIRSGWAISQVGYLGRWKMKRDHGVRARSPRVLGSQRHQLLRVTEKGRCRAPADRVPVQHAHNDQANRGQSRQAVGHQTEGRDRITQAGHEGYIFSPCTCHRDAGGQNADVFKVPSTNGPVGSVPSGAQELQAVGLFTVHFLEDVLWMVLLFGKLPVCGGLRRDGHLCQVFVCAAQRGGSGRQLKF